MGRSQVQRNKAHGRPGTKGRGAGRGRGDSDKTTRGKRQDLSKLGDNSYRFENRSTEHATEELVDGYDGLLDAINFSGYIEHDEFLEESPVGEGESDYLSIDVAALAKCLEQLPIAERLNMPQHVGEHLEEMYGGVRKKTLGEMREDAKVRAADGKTKAGAKATPHETKAAAAGDEDDLEAWLDDMIA